MTPSCGGRLRQLAEGRGRPDHLEAAALDDLVDLARDGDRERELPALAVRADQPKVEEQRLLDRDLVSALVDQIEPLGGPVEDHAEVRADRGDELLGLADQAAQARGGAVRARRAERVGCDRLDVQRTEDDREHERGRRVAVVDDDPVRPAADRLLVERLEQVLRVALAGAHRVVHIADRVA